MPEIISIRRIHLDFVDLRRRRPITRPDTPLSRAPGLHLSDILRHIAVKIGKMKQGERLESDYPWRMAMGVMWEEFYFSLLGQSEWQPGELTRDGISVNADGISVHPTFFGREMVSVLEETKCTECKIVETEDDLLEKFSANWWYYQHQTRGYCYCYGPRVVRWSMLHYRGDWAGSGPVGMEYVVRFSDQEVEQTWMMVWKGRQEMLAVTEDDVPF